jgi:exodeoxyribonuclease-3
LSTQYEIYINSAVKLGYSGTALFIKKNTSKNAYQILKKEMKDKFNDEGRMIIYEDQNLCLLNGYFPNGQDDHGRVPYKLEFSFDVLDFAAKKSSEKITIITGDLNTAHTEIDLKNPKSNKYRTGFLNIEREYIDQLIEAKFVDVFRKLNPDKIDAYTWWSYRNNCRFKNVGWRLDYFFINNRMLNCVHDIQIVNEVHGSDHCPVHLHLNLE